MNKTDTNYRTFPLLPKWRWMTAIPLGTMIATGAFVFIGLSGSDVWWWAFLIMAIPILLAIVMTMEFARLRIELSAQGLRYHNAGYVAEAAWSEMSRPGAGQVLVLDNPKIILSPWLGWMAAIVAIFQPVRSHLASSAMRVIELKYFDDGTLDAALREGMPAPSAPPAQAGN